MNNTRRLCIKCGKRKRRIKGKRKDGSTIYDKLCNKCHKKKYNMSYLEPSGSKDGDLSQKIRQYIFRKPKCALEKYMGCSRKEYLKHLQETAIKNGYKDFDIENYDHSLYHIDHIIPRSAFNLTCSFHRKLCFHYSNVQILKAKYNLVKGNKKG